MGLLPSSMLVGREDAISSAGVEAVEGIGTLNAGVAPCIATPVAVVDLVVFSAEVGVFNCSMELRDCGVIVRPLMGDAASGGLREDEMGTDGGVFAGG